MTRPAARPRPAAPQLAADAWRSMRMLVLDLHDRRHQASAAVELSFLRIKALKVLDVGPTTMRELSGRLGADPPYVTLISQDLEQRGLVRRTVHPTDRRAKLLSITPAGQAVLARAEAVLDEPPPALLDLTSQELEILTVLLDRVVEAVEGSPLPGAASPAPEPEPERRKRRRAATR